MQPGTQRPAATGIWQPPTCGKPGRRGCLLHQRLPRWCRRAVAALAHCQQIIAGALGCWRLLLPLLVLLVHWLGPRLPWHSRCLHAATLCLRFQHCSVLASWHRSIRGSVGPAAPRAAPCPRYCRRGDTRHAAPAGAAAKAARAHVWQLQQCILPPSLPAGCWRGWVLKEGRG